MRGIRGYLRYFTARPLLWMVDENVSMGWVSKRALVSRPYKYCYFRIPKCANSSVLRTLAYYDNQLPYDENDHRGGVYKLLYSGIEKSGCWTAKGLLNNYFCFTFVRNPYARLLSAYLDKLVNKTGDAKYEHVKARIRDLSEKGEVSFDGFVKYLEVDGVYANAHWCPQHKLMPLDPKDIHFIGHVETFSQDIEELVNRIFGASTYAGDKTRTAGQTSASQRLTDFYTSDLAERVYGLYQDDFSCFGYSQNINELFPQGKKSN